MLDITMHGDDELIDQCLNDSYLNRVVVENGALSPEAKLKNAKGVFKSTEKQDQEFLKYFE